MLSGKDEPRVLLSEQIDWRSLMRLTQDILYIRNHTGIRITNGPGDGKRDLHSLSALGESHLAQCKFHQDSDKTCSSDELGELPLAMIKLGYTNGLFVTNARISPQGKREYLDNYRNLNLEFFDGDTLVLEIMRSPLLKSLWFDGKSIVDIHHQITVPLLIRRHSDDIPINLDRENALDSALEYLSNIWPDKDFQVKSLRTTRDSFFPYRPSSLPTMHEGMSSFITATAVIVRGDIALIELDKIAESIAQAFLSALADWLDSFSIVLGAPEFGDGEFKSSAQPIETDRSRRTWLQTMLVCSSESDFFFVEPEGPEWSAESDARSTGAEAIRFYSPKLDCCLAYDIEFEVMCEIEPFRISMRAFNRRGWQKSLFAILPSFDEWTLPIPEPDETIEWTWDGRIICGWFHDALRGSVNMPQGRIGESSHLEELDATSVKRLAAIRIFLRAQEFEIISADKARHMVAVQSGHDILAERTQINYFTGQIAYYPEELLSPLSPLSRRFCCSIAWSATRVPEDLKEIAVRTAVLIGLPISNIEDSIVKCGDEEFLLVEFECSIMGSDAMHQPTWFLMKELHDLIGAWLEEIELQTRLCERATKQYWSSAFGVHFGISWGKQKSG